MAHQERTKSSGFTIVELIIVVIVIGILVGVAIIGYGTWRSTTITNVLKSDLTGASSALEASLTWGSGTGGYPATIPSTFTASANVTLAGGGSADGSTYCISATSTQITTLVFYVSKTQKTPTAGACPAVTGVVTTLAGTSGSSSYVDATGSIARFGGPYGIAVDSTGLVYVDDNSSGVVSAVRKVTASAGATTTFVGQILSGFVNNTGTLAKINGFGIAVDGSGNVFIADVGNNAIRKVTSAGVVTTFAGQATAGFTNATGTSAQFNGPYDIAVDASGNVYVADGNNNSIRKITSGGVVTTLAGQASSGLVNANGTSAKFNSPNGIAVDTSGNVYVADTANYAIRKITPTGDVTTLAGSTYGYADGTGTAALFRAPSGIAVDTSGTVYVADTVNHAIRMITPAGVVTTIAGLGGTNGYADGTGTVARFKFPWAIDVDSSGILYVADRSNYVIRKIVLQYP